jgi:hypothetical protein
MAPVTGIHENVERGLVELKHVHAQCRQLAGLLIEQPGKGHRHIGAPGIIGIGDGVADCHRARQRELQLALGSRPGEADLLAMHRSSTPHRACYCWHLDDIAVGANSHPRLPVDSLDGFQKAVHEMDAELLAVADDVDAGVFLLLEPN